MNSSQYDTVTHVMALLFAFTASHFGATIIAQELEPRRVSVATPEYGSDWLTVPKRRDIVRMSARCFNHPFGIADVAEFEVSQKCMESILDELTHDCVTDENPRFGLEIAVLSIETKDGRSEHITVYWTRGKSSLTFSYRGVRVCQTNKGWKKNFPGKTVGDGSLRIDDVLRDDSANNVERNRASNPR